jgi:hypothetical protein
MNFGYMEFPSSSEKTAINNATMVRVDKNYEAHIIRKWSTNYLDYDKLKALLAKEDPPADDVVVPQGMATR